MSRHKLTTGAILIGITILCHLPGYTQQTYSSTAKYVKKGWSVIPLPTFSFDTDLGLQVGAMVDSYYFGDGSLYPEYLHKVTAQASYFTKGSGIFHAFYDSGHVLRDLRLTTSISYIPNRMMAFFGFNGYPAPLLENVGNAFYAVDRNLFRIMGDIQGRFGGNFGWAAGISYYNVDTGSVRLERYRDEETLYHLYVNEGLIRDNEKNGGNHLELRIGAVYDTRDHEPDPSRGVYIDAILYGSPDIIDRNGYSYLKLAVSFRNFVPVIPNRITLAYRLSYQGRLAGETPFYMLQNYVTLFLRQINSDILGGGISLRGVAYNRIAADGLAWANTELRFRLFEFMLLKQKWYFVLNPFFDIGMAVQKYRLEEMRRTGDSRIYSGDPPGPHMSAGLGAKLVLNDNFVLSAEYGVPLDGRDGDGGLYLNLNYIF